MKTIDKKAVLAVLLLVSMLFAVARTSQSFRAIAASATKQVL
jgi:hypothetical protein